MAMPARTPGESDLFVDEEGEEEAAGALDVVVWGELDVALAVELYVAVAAALDAADVELTTEPGIGGAMSKAGELLTLLELVSSVILNLYCWLVGTSTGMTRVALPVFGSTANRRRFF
jgi:hypothetical protein